MAAGLCGREEYSLQTRSTGEYQIAYRHQSERRLAPKCNTINVLYADPGGLVTKCCYGIPQCFHRYHALRETGTQAEIDNQQLIGILGVSFDIDIPYHRHPPHHIAMKHLRSMAESDVLLCSVNVEILAFATFVYLCFFFFFAFNPHRSTDLAELSAIVEEEIAQLSILTSKAVQSIKAEKQVNVAPAVLLMKRPEQSTQESLEEVRGPGETCNSWLCPHNRHHRE
ncbi:unnamed protein product [Angiostrongylus costaricensis]|uniref:Junction plakoglobin n=1 Tax=Angiostrongylus costaricensis TaxID=334426 RepID=A0A0R3PN37_ANGCS|nr:unnamed protein product [Angiostrongylus costaricensis]